jgi:short-subunit dehydrogenase
MKVVRNPVVVINGGTSGVGRATARHFASHGASVAILARGLDRLEAARSELKALGARVEAISVDVADAGQVEAAAERIEQSLGPIDIWINNAMTSVFSRVWEVLPEEYLRVTQVTYLGYVHGTLSALKRMRRRNSGCILQVGSALAYRGIPLQSAYCAAKHAIQGFTDSLRTELLNEKSKVRVCEVHLPAVNTPQFAWVKSRLAFRAQPVPPIYQPELPAEVIYRASHADRREWLLGWPTYLAIWGNKIAPRFADYRLAKMGFQAQQTHEPEDPLRPVNLWTPPPGDYGCHGRFDAQARDKSPLYLMSRFRSVLFPGLAAAIACALVFFRGRPGKWMKA